MNNETELLKYFRFTETLKRFPSRRECKDAGLKIYQGKLCQRDCGHGFRLTCNGACVDCEATMVIMRREMKKLIRDGKVCEFRAKGRLYYRLPFAKGDFVKAFDRAGGQYGVISLGHWTGRFGH